jgi:hypothetical protein
MIFIEVATPVDITRCPLSAGRADVPAAGLQSESLVVGSPGAAPVPAMAWNTWDAVGLRYWVPGTPGVGASLITRESGGHSGPTGSANSRSGRRDTDRPSGRRDIAFESGVNSGPGITQIHHVAGLVITGSDVITPQRQPNDADSYEECPGYGRRESERTLPVHRSRAY